jgi:hypothetical protein
MFRHRCNPSFQKEVLLGQSSVVTNGNPDWYEIMNVIIIRFRWQELIDCYFFFSLSTLLPVPSHGNRFPALVFQAEQESALLRRKQSETVCHIFFLTLPAFLLNLCAFLIPPLTLQTISLL